MHSVSWSRSRDERVDLGVEPRSPGPGDAVPVGLVRRALARQRRERLADLGQAEPHGLRGADERQPPEHVPVVPALGAVGAGRRDETLTFVEPQRRRRDPGPVGDRADAQQLVVPMVAVRHGALLRA